MIFRKKQKKLGNKGRNVQSCKTFELSKPGLNKSAYTALRKGLIYQKVGGLDLGARNKD